MSTRAMIVVAGGSSTRFGSDKLLADVDGKPLISHTLDTVTPSVDRCVVVCRSGLEDVIRSAHPNVEIAPGGATRTLSEISGLTVVGDGADLIGIHDAARPMVPGILIDRLFRLAHSQGGAAPLLAVDEMVVSKKSHRLVSGLYRAQTPQVFRAPELMAAYVRAAKEDFEGHDTVEVVARYSDITIVGIPGRPGNVKVTYPEDLEEIRRRQRASSRT